MSALEALVGELRRELRAIVREELEHALAARAQAAPEVEYFDTAGVAKRLGVSPRSVRNFVAREGLPMHPVGSLYRFKPAEVEAWIEARRGAPPRRRRAPKG